MKLTMSLLATLLFAAGLSACSEMPQQSAQSAQAPKEEAEYITGSLLPLKRNKANGNKVNRMTPQEIEEMQRKQAQTLPDGMGSK